MVGWLVAASPCRQNDYLEPGILVALQIFCLVAGMWLHLVVPGVSPPPPLKLTGLSPWERAWLG